MPAAPAVPGAPAGAGPLEAPAPERRPGPLPWLIGAGLMAAVALHLPLAQALQGPAAQTWATLCVAVCVQALPFLALGIAVSTLISTLVPDEALARVLPSNPARAVPVAGLAGALLPGCECGSVPVASGLISRGVPHAAALTFLLAAPAVNPVVMVSTWVAFPGNPQMVLARLAASLATAIGVGLLWVRIGRADWLVQASLHHRHGSTGRLEHARQVASHDLLQSGGFLVVGAMTSATLHVLVPRDALDAVADHPVLSVLALAGLAVVLAVCSEADAFVAASLTQFSPTARLAFMVVGPVVDVKLVALHAGTFGRRFAVRFAPLALATAVVGSVAIGALL